jgi:hypothetical protein
MTVCHIFTRYSTTYFIVPFFILKVNEELNSYTTSFLALASDLGWLSYTRGIYSSSKKKEGRFWSCHLHYSWDLFQ